MSEQWPDGDASALVSIVIPCFNGEQYIRSAVRSALRQTHRNIEIIVVDDGSTDGSGAVLEAEFGGALKIIRIPNSGPSRARNVGFDHSRGDFVQFLDADNVITPEKLERSLGLFAAEPAVDIVWTAIHEPAEYAFEDESQFSAEDLQKSVDAMMDRAYELVLPGTGMLALETSQPLFRRSALETYGRWDEELRVMEDTELVARHALRGAEIRHLPMVGLIYRDHPGERVTRRMRFDNATYFRTVLKMIATARELDRMTGGIEDFTMKFLIWIAALECVRQRRYETARQYVTLARQIRRRLPGPALFRAASAIFGVIPALVAARYLIGAFSTLFPQRSRALLGVVAGDPDRRGDSGGGAGSGG
ncbi:glycosyltransferase family 2 protein [Streptomyces sp. NPDC014894]|uniref:glycosyltransferase family 2 protein n=1 Tax=Streptomyces sp. NPDC014894 TaxID=3364931 RepID=UPI0036FE329B